MIRVKAMLVAVLGLSACSSIEHADKSSIEQATVASLVGAYSLGEAESPSVGCQVTLRETPEGHAAGYIVRSISVSPACGEHFAALRAIRQWAWTGGGSIALLGGDPTRELSNFSPVQDGSGVYLRGGFGADTKVYELRRPE